MSIEHEVVDLMNRIATLERVIRDVPSYIDNWDWEKQHYDVLKTIPDFEFLTVKMADRWESEKKDSKE